MNSFRLRANQVLGEIAETFERLNPEEIEGVTAVLAEATRVFIIGVGREGLVAKAFAMRLMHAGLEVHWAWDDTTPNMNAGDVMVMVNGSGAIGHLDYVFGQVKSTGATTIVVTGVPDADTPLAADFVLHVPATVFHGHGELVPSVQPMGSLFEQACLIAYDLMVVDIALRRSSDPEAMAARHRNFE